MKRRGFLAFSFAAPALAMVPLGRGPTMLHLATGAGSQYLGQHRRHCPGLTKYGFESDYFWSPASGIPVSADDPARAISIRMDDFKPFKLSK